MTQRLNPLYPTTRVHTISINTYCSLTDNSHEWKYLLLNSFDKLSSKSTMKKIKLAIRIILGRKILLGQEFTDAIILWKLR